MQIGRQQLVTDTGLAENERQPKAKSIYSSSGWIKGGLNSLYNYKDWQNMEFQNAQNNEWKDRWSMTKTKS